MLNILGEEETKYWEKSKKDRQTMRQKKGNMLYLKILFCIIIVSTLFSVRKNFKVCDSEGISKYFSKGGSRHNHANILGVAKLQPRPCFQRWKHDNLV